ncbi:MAG: translocation/assembly module TamB [Odoribacteraceae bacterium]|jgi:hypothetical protein|nr:translocation/assembly module TamB [Odoribacteraceae bacterium]
MKSFKKIANTFSLCVILLGMLVMGIYLALMTPFIQTRLVGYFTRQLGERTGLNISIGKVDFRPLETIVLEEVLLRDERQDTVLFVGRLFARLDSVRLMHRSCVVRELRLEKAFLDYRVPDGGGSPLDSLLAAFSRGDDAPGNAPGWRINLSGIELRDCRVNYADADPRPVEAGVNWTDMECQEVYATLRAIEFPGGGFRARVEGLRLKEKSGLTLHELTANVFADSARLLVTDGSLRVEESRLHLDTLAYEWIPGAGYWRDFVRKMPQRYLFSDAEVHLDDLFYFSDALQDLHGVVSGSGEVYNTVDNLAGRNIDLFIGEKSRVRADFRANGLLRVEDARLEIDLQETLLSPAELRGLYLPWIEEHYLPIPGILDRYDTFNISGTFSGELLDFIITARCTTPGIGGNVVVTYRSGENGYDYAGELHMDHVDYARLSGQDFLGAGTFDGKFSGGYPRDTSFLFEGEAARVSLFDGVTRDVKLSVNGTGNRYHVRASVDNDSVRALVAAEYETRDSMTSIRARGEMSVRKWDSWAPTLFAPGESIAARFAGEWNEGRKGGRDECRADLRLSLGYSNERGSIEIDPLHFAHAMIAGEGRTTLESNLVDVELAGNYQGLQPGKLWDYLLYTYFPSSEQAVRQPLPGLDLSCSVVMKNLNAILPLLYPGVSLSDQATLLARHEQTGDIRLEFTADSIDWEMLHLRQPKLRVNGNSDSIKSTCTVAMLHYEPIGKIYNLRDATRIRADRVSNELTWNNWGRETYSGAISFDIGLARYGNWRVTQLLVHPGVIIIGDATWRIGQSLVLRERDNFFINNFEIQRDDQLFRLKGRVGENPRDTLLVQFENLKLADVGHLIPGNRLPLFGLLNGRVRLQDLYHDRLVHANIELTNWGIAGDTLGVLGAHSYWDDRQQILRIDVANRTNDRDSLYATGHYDPSKNLVDMNLVTSIDAGRVTRYFPGILGRGSGRISGGLSLKGPSGDPRLDGFLHFDHVAIPVEPVHTTFTLNDRVEIKGSRVIFDHLQLLDNNANTASISGYHDIETGRPDVNLQFKNFMIVDATATGQSAAYGQLAITGRTRIHAPAGIYTLTANLKTEHSRLFVPLGSTGLDDEYNFLHFSNTARDARPAAASRRRQTPATAPFDFDVSVEVTNDLELQLILDPTVGDILKSVGKGDLRVSIGKDNQLNLFGEYAIEQGEYLFTMGNLVNKQFILHPGGHITWNGDPTNATIDVTALYPLRTALGDLVQDAVSDWDTRDYTTKIPVECTLHLTDNLMNPTINFGIEFPSLDSRTRGTLQGLLDSPDEINKQVFALLLMNRFYPRDQQDVVISDASYQTGVATASEMLSRQFSRWLSRLASNLDVDVAYRPGDRETNNEFEVALSTRVWNNRVSISANGNVIEKAKDTGQTPVTGDFDVEVKLNPQGTLKLEAYSHTDTKITYNATETVQGIGVSYQEHFDTFRELLRNYLGLFKSKQQRLK